MDRRTFLATSSAGVALAVAGCQNVLGGNPGSGPETTTAPADGLRIVSVYGQDIDREFVDGEFVVLENTAADSLDLSGYAVEFSAGHTFRFTDLVLEPDARLAVVGRDGQGSVLQMSPPFYLRYLEPDSGPLLGSSGTVRVRNANDALVADTTYESFGCDDGNATGDGMDCLYTN
jgi:hypothetical protein